jgi:hypothetical protein
MLLPHKVLDFVENVGGKHCGSFFRCTDDEEKKSLMMLQPATRQRRLKVGTPSESRNLRGADVIKLSP